MKIQNLVTALAIVAIVPVGCKRFSNNTSGDSDVRTAPAAPANVGYPYGQETDRDYKEYMTKKEQEEKEKKEKLLRKEK